MVDLVEGFSNVIFILARVGSWLLAFPLYFFSCLVFLSCLCFPVPSRRLSFSVVDIFLVFLITPALFLYPVFSFVSVFLSCSSCKLYGSGSASQC